MSPTLTLLIVVELVTVNAVAEEDPFNATILVLSITTQNGVCDHVFAKLIVQDVVLAPVPTVTRPQLSLEYDDKEGDVPQLVTLKEAPLL